MLANFGIVLGGTSLGLFDVATAQGITQSLGMGLMMGSGFGVVLRDIVPQIVRVVRGSGRTGTASARTDNGLDTDVRTASARTDNGLDTDARTASARTDNGLDIDVRGADAGLLALCVASAALLACFGLALGPVATIVIVLLSFVTTIMSAQSVGQTGIDPMEIFGLIVLLAVAALGETSQVKLIFVAGIVAVACGLGGDVMSDFKTGHILGTDPRQMWIGQAIGALLGTVVSVVTMAALAGAYGTEAFGPGQQFVSAQASVVATAISGIPSIPAFVLGLVAGVALYCLGLPSMMVGLGVYLPFYLSLAAPIGALAKLVYDRLRRGASDDDGIIVASGLLGGESIVGVVIALVAVVSGLLA